MKPIVLSAIISGVATVLAALITAWSVRGVRGGDARQTTEAGASQGSRSQAEDRQPQEFETELVRERQRGRIAIFLVITLLVVVVGTLWYVLTAWSPSALVKQNDLATILALTFMAPLVGLIGAVVGFYYGAQAATLAASQVATEAASQDSLTAQRPPEEAPEEPPQEQPRDR